MSITNQRIAAHKVIYAREKIRARNRYALEGQQ